MGTDAERSVRPYALLLARSIARRDAVRTTACPDTDDWKWWSAWGPEERARFFHALGVHSRHRPDLIAAALPQRSVEEVGDALYRFDRASRRVDRLERTQGSSRQKRLRRCPAAREMSTAWLAQEETLADALAHGSDRIAWELRSTGTTAAVARFLNRPDAYPLWDTLAQLVCLPPTPAWPETLMPTEAYRAYMHVYAVPVLATREALFQLVRALVHDGYLQLAPWDAQRMDPDTLLLPAECMWRVPESAPTVQPESLVDTQALGRRLVGRTHAGYAGAALVPAWTAQLRAFLTHVLSELVLVSERALRPTAIDEQHVWTCMARLGYPVYTPASAPEDDVRARLDAGLLGVLAEVRVLADPPVAWAQRIPDPVPEGIAVAQTFTMPSASSESGADTDGSGSDALADDTPGDYDGVPEPVGAPHEDHMRPPPDENQHGAIPGPVRPWPPERRIGALAPLVPYEYTRNAPVEPHSSSDEESDASDDDRAVDALDQDDDHTYEQRLVQAWWE